MILRPNPLDSLFLAIDEAWRRCRLAPPDLHLVLECRGRVDVDGLRRALRALRRLYPATAGRLRFSWLRQQPYWRLNGASQPAEPSLRQPAMRQPPTREPETCEPETWEPETRAPSVALHGLSPPTAAALDEQIARRAAQRIDYATQPPLRLDVYRGLPRGDVVVARWPHALTDAVGGVTLVGELARLYDEAPELDTLRSRGDELRTDFGALNPSVPFGQCLRTALAGARDAAMPSGWGDVRLCPTALAGRERLRHVVRRMSAEETRAMRECSTLVAGFGRLGAFVRAAGIRAINELAPAPSSDRIGHTTLHLVDNRRKRDFGPVCRNVFSTLLVYAPGRIASDRRAMVQHVHAQTTEVVRAGLMQQRLTALQALALLPTPLLASLMERSIRRGEPSWPLSVAPTMPLGFIGAPRRAERSFCGAELENHYVLRTTSPLTGFSLQANLTHDRMNISASFYEPRVTADLMRELLERIVVSLTRGP